MPSLELLAPAGTLDKLQTALDFGADAVYAGGAGFSLRAAAGGLTLPEVEQARELTRRRGKRLYLTLNAYLQAGELDDFAAYLEQLRPLDLDAYIVADPGALELIHNHDPGRPVHLSTQANATNPAAVRFWARAGISRVILARELALREIAATALGAQAEIEVFVHGAQCIAYSGRCLLSAALTGRSANRGACTHSCRWNYALQEATRPGTYLPLEEDGRGSYLLNSRDLCLLEALPDLVGEGVTAFKIEGRMKSRYYVGAVTRVYRAALDLLQEKPTAFAIDPLWLEELEGVSHRPYGTGFLYGREQSQVHAEDANYRRGHDFLGVVAAVGRNGLGEVEVRGRFMKGERLELIGPAMRLSAFTVETIDGRDGNQPVAQPNQRVRLELPEGARGGDLLRRRTR